MADSKNLNLDAYFSTGAAALGAAYSTADAAIKGIQSVQNAWNANNADSRRNIGGGMFSPQYQSPYPQGQMPVQCAYPYADTYVSNPYGMMGAPSYTPNQPTGYFGFTDQGYGVTAGVTPIDPFAGYNNGPKSGWWY